MADLLDSDGADAELSAAELRQASDAATLNSLRGFAASTASVYVVLGISHLTMVAPPYNIPLAVVALSSSAFCFAVFLVAPVLRRRRAYGLAQPAVAFCAAIVLFNSLFHIFLTRELWHSTNVMLFAVGVGGLFLDFGWACGGIIASWIGWTWICFYSEDLHVRFMDAFYQSFPEAPRPTIVEPGATPHTMVGLSLAPHWLFGLLTSTLLGFTILRTRMLLLKSEETMRKRDRIKQEQLADLTNRYRVMAQLAQQASAAKSEFLRNISHNLRTPLHGIIGMTEELLLCPLGKEERELASTVRTSADALLAIVGDLLDFSKIEAGRMEVSPSVFELRPWLAEVLRPLELNAQRSGLKFSFVVDSTVPEQINVDSNRLAQILTNLVGNSNKFVEHGAVSVHVSNAPSLDGGSPSIRISVKDTGPGIPPDKCAAIFDPFTQVDGSTSRKHEGSGLGLAISRRMAELMGGKLWIAWSKVGVGSEFVLELHVGLKEEAPRSSGLPDLHDEKVPELPHLRPSTETGKELDEDTETLRGGSGSIIGDAVENLVPFKTIPDSEPTTGLRQRHGPSVPSAVESPLKILVAEDNSVNREIVKRMLARRGHSVSLAVDGVEALEMFQAESFDLVISDIGMPRMDGFELLKRIRDTGRTIPVIALTAHAMEADRRACEEAGFDGWLSKPLESSKLFNLLLEFGRRIKAGVD